MPEPLTPQGEMDIFMHTLEQALNSQVRPGSTIAAEAVGVARRAVEKAREEGVGPNPLNEGA